jgi:hypothetical protein
VRKTAFAPGFGSQLVEGARSYAQSRDQKPAPARITFGDVWRGSIGAAMGAGVARGVSRILGLRPRMADKVESIGLALGAASNTGRIKMAEQQDRENAFKLGAATVAAAAPEEAVRKVAMMVKMPFLPVFMNPLETAKSVAKAPFGLVRSVQALGERLGAGAEVDSRLEKRLSEEALHEVLLREKLDKLLAQKRNRTLRDVLRSVK